MARWLVKINDDEDEKFFKVWLDNHHLPATRLPPINSAAAAEAVPRARRAKKAARGYTGVGLQKLFMDVCDDGKPHSKEEIGAAFKKAGHSPKSVSGTATPLKRAGLIKRLPDGNYQKI